MEFLKQIGIDLVRFVILGGAAAAGVFAGMALRRKKDAGRNA